MADGATTQSTQAPTQTQVASQHENMEDSDLWGFLIPSNANNPNISRINFHKSQTKYTVGRNPKNDICFAKCMTVSNSHCVIEWDGDDSAKSAVKVTDFSSNGTWINGERVGEEGREKYKILHDGNEIAFGSWMRQPAERSHEDYRFIFRHRASGTSRNGLDKFYDVQNVLGRGSFATVVKALHRTEGIWYAVKIIQANKLRKGMTNTGAAGLQPDTLPTNLKREIDILKRLNHRNICQFKEFFVESNSISIVLELVKGGDLLDYLDVYNALSESHTQYITYQICDALAYVHSLGIAHRDLKPENILLTETSPPIVKIADFGLAKVVDTLTVLHTMCGTPAYLAPEVVTNGQKEGYDQVVDSWSVGVIVFSLLTMCTPFREDKENTDIAKQVANRQVEWEVLKMRNVSELAESFIRRLLEYDPKKRMSLTDARDHPWLAEQAALQRAGTRQPGITKPPSAIHPSVRVSQLPSQALVSDASMRSAVSDRMVLDTPSVVMSSQPPAGPDDSRSTTPSHDSQEFELSSSQHVGIAASEAAGRGQPSRVQRRVDVIRRAQNMGVDLPGPSQGMQDRAVAAASADSADAEPKSVPADGGKDKDKRPAQPSRRSRGSKRKAREFDPESSPDPIAGWGPVGDGGGHNTGEASTSGAPKASPRRPSTKKARTEARSTDDSGAVDEIPGLTSPRRSSRLTSSTKQNQSRKG